MEEVYLNVGKQVAVLMHSIHQSSSLILKDEVTDIEPSSDIAIEIKSSDPVDPVASETKNEEVVKVPYQVPIEDKFENAISASKANVSPNAIEEDQHTLVHPEFVKLSGKELLKSRVYGLLLKRLIIFGRSPVLLLVQLFLPPIVLLFFYGLLHIHFIQLDALDMDFNLDGYPEELTIVYSFTPNDDKELADIAAKYKGLFTGRHQAVEKTNVTQFLADEAKRLGYLKFGNRYLIAATFCKGDNDTIIAVALYNPFPCHSQPISLNYVINALAKHYGRESQEIQGGMYQPSKRSRGFKEGDRVKIDPIIFIFATLFLLNIVCASFLLFIIKERRSGSKHLQLLSGTSPLVYWCTNFIVDFFVFLVPNLLNMAVVEICDLKPFSDDLYMHFTVVLILFSMASTAFMYCLEALFHSPANGMAAAFLFNFMATLVTVMIALAGYVERDDIYDVLFAIILPNYDFFIAFLSIHHQRSMNSFCAARNYKSSCLEEHGRCCKNYGLGCHEEEKSYLPKCFEVSENYFRYDGGIMKYLNFLALQSVFYFILRVLGDYGLFQKLRLSLQKGSQAVERHSDDDDVALEQERVNASPPSQLLLVNLWKIFGNLVAVDGISVGVEKGECFGLLGENGAGKTTTFKMITGMETITSGDVYFNGISIRQHLTEVQSNMGYCPQVDALIDRMTVRQMLDMYARLRGLPDDKIKPSVEYLVEKLDLKRHGNRLTKDLSGGNKRKVSTAIALIGDPPLILLDEPSSGLDPGARIHMWEVLSAVRASGKTIILTSHSMEECEALCTRITIMMKGRMVCLGSLQHIKSKFAQGYTLLVKMGKDTVGTVDDVEPVLQHIQCKLPSSYLFSTCEGFAHLQVPDPNVHLADVFEVLEECKVDLNLEDYSVQQTSLEQVFLKLAHDTTPHSAARCFCLGSLLSCCE